MFDDPSPRRLVKVESKHGGDGGEEEEENPLPGRHDFLHQEFAG
jgi:hypothetical protein